MAIRASSILRVVGGLAGVCLALAWAAAATNQAPPSPGFHEPCLPATSTTIELAPQTAPGASPEASPEASIDEIRVLLSERSPAGGAIDVHVTADAGGSRVLRVRQPASRILSFSPGMPGNTFEVTLEPVVEVAESACVREVVLVSRGEVVAAVRP